MKFDLRTEALNRMMIVAHRGIAGGNIPCNTLQAYDAALLQGADMIELDVSGSADGGLFVFHPGMEPVQLRSERYIKDMSSDEVRNLRFVNQDGTPTQYGVSTLDEAFEHLKNRCYINVDKYWDNIGSITETIRRHNMMDQVLVKCGPSEESFRLIEEVAPDVNYMVILRDKDEWSDNLLRRKINYVGVEALFAQEDCELATAEYVQRMNKKGLIVWANSIVYNYKAVLTAGHNDDISLVGRMDEGWGWLMDRGYNFIQTDWPLALKLYAESRKKNG